MKIRKNVIVVLSLIIFAIWGAVCISRDRPSFEIIKGNNPAVEFSADKLKIDINTAGLKELDSIEGIGYAMAERIIAYRESIGGFTDISQLLDVQGIGEKKLDAIKDSIIIVQ